LKDFLDKRIKQGLSGNVTPQSFDQVVEEELGEGDAS